MTLLSRMRCRTGGLRGGWPDEPAGGAGVEQNSVLCPSPWQAQVARPRSWRAVPHRRRTRETSNSPSRVKPLHVRDAKRMPLWLPWRPRGRKQKGEGVAPPRPGFTVRYAQWRWARKHCPESDVILSSPKRSQRPLTGSTLRLRSGPSSAQGLGVQAGKGRPTPHEASAVALRACTSAEATAHSRLRAIALQRAGAKADGETGRSAINCERVGLPGPGVAELGEEGLVVPGQVELARPEVVVAVTKVEHSPRVDFVREQKLG